MIDTEELAFELFAVYTDTDNLEQFCLRLDLDPELPASIELFESVHVQFVQTWTEMGEDQFFRLLEAHRR